MPRNTQLKHKYPAIADALAAYDNHWWRRQLIIFPSHLLDDDVEQMVSTAHAFGFDAVVGSIFLNNDEYVRHRQFWRKNWEERWTIHNPRCADSWQHQAEALGRSAWPMLCQTMLKT